MSDRRTPRPALPRRLLALCLGGFVGLGTVAVAPAARADLDEDTVKEEQQIDRTKRRIDREGRDESKARSRLNSLRHQEQDLKFRKRTGDPFRSKRALRNDLRSNEARQGWQKREARRFDFEVRQGERRLRNQTRDLRRSRSR